MYSIPKDVEALVSKLELQTHPEGGFYKETYKSNDIVATPERFAGKKRSASTSIYYLLSGEQFSAWHKIKSDETWSFHRGSSLLIHMIDSQGLLKTQKLGDPIESEDALYQITIPAEHWFSAEVEDKKSYVLVGCFVSPGFEFKDFELANRKTLSYQFPQLQNIIERLTRNHEF